MKCAQICVTLCLIGMVVAQCPDFNTTRLPKCPHRTDNELCVLAANQDSDRLSDFEFMDMKDIGGADPLACKLRAAAIRQHVLFHGSRNHGSLNCKRASAVFETNGLPSVRIADLCDAIGFSRCHTCFHQGLPVLNNNGTCTCACKHGWAGRDCSECGLSPAECMHDGDLITANGECRCECKYPWAGVHCETCNRACKNKGFSDPTDQRCKCQCPWPWTGIECEECPLECQHSGVLVSTNNTCRCDCPPLATGPQCEQCTARCLNGGILDKDTCTCKCLGGFTGHQCENCDIKCKYNSTLLNNECRCKCDNPYTSGLSCEVCSNNCNGRGREVGCKCVDCKGHWSGETCNECSLRCENDGELNERACKCACDTTRCKHGQINDDCTCKCQDFWRGTDCDQCFLNCKHGVLNRDNCSCTCDSNFSGPRCDKCELNCTGRGILDSGKCECTNCTFPYYGKNCANQCTIKCAHGAVLDRSDCTCKQCPLPWSGKTCGVCTLGSFGDNPCVHGTFDAANCRCVCPEGWGGSLCQLCERTCLHGSLNNKTCTCNCNKNWLGSNCTDCGLTCQNGGVLDRKNCFCNCDHDHSGTTCQGAACYMQISCDACLSASDGCEWCAKSSTCSKMPGPDTVSSCIGPTRTGTCPPYGDCNVCAYTKAELQWLSDNGDRSSNFLPKNSLMPDSEGNVADPDVGCDASRKMTWCEFKQMCVQNWVGGINGPCEPMKLVYPKPTVNGFVSS